MKINDIEIFKKCIYNYNEKINNVLNIRTDSKIFFKDIIFYSSLVIGNSSSFEVVNSQLKVNNILDVSKTALINRKNNLHADNILELNNDLLNHIYSSKKPRIIGIDSTFLALLKEVKKYGFSFSRNNMYCTALLSTLFDIEKEIPINYFLMKNKNERDGLLNQLQYVNKNDILVMDRGYYSIDLLFILNEKKIKVIFRLKKNLLIIKKLKNKTDITIDVTNNNKIISFRLVKYKINKKWYYIGTTIFNKSINYIKDIYWKRWKIETHFRHSKYNLSLKDLKSKSENAILQDIYIHQFIYIVSSYFKYMLQKTIIQNNRQINTKNHLYMTINNLLYLLIYKPNSQKIYEEINRILNISKKVIVIGSENRHNPRIRKRPVTKWCAIGNLYKFT